MVNPSHSGIHTLAAELILEIFDWYTVTHTHTPDDPSRNESLNLTTVEKENTFLPSTRGSPWILGQICSEWRKVALGAPRLWSSINISIYSSAKWGRGKGRERKNLFEEYLRRSGDSPLYLHIFSMLDWHPWLTIICHHTSRWKSASIYQSQTGYRRLAGMIPNNLPQLRFLRVGLLSSGGMIPSWNESIPINAFPFKAAPELKILCIMWMGQNVLEFKLPWKQLTRFEWIPPPGVDAEVVNNLNNLETLQRIPNLEQASFGCAFSSTLNTQPGVLTHTLSSLHLSSIASGKPGSDHITQLLDKLTLPSLECLIIRILPLQTEMDRRESVARFLERSRAYNLETLVLDNLTMSIEAFAMVFDAAPNLIYFGFGDTPDGIFNLLEYNPNDAPHRLPRLRCFELGGSSLEAETRQNMLFRVVHSRTTPNGYPGNNLKVLNLSKLNPNLCRELLAKIKDFGLAVSTTHSLQTSSSAMHHNSLETSLMPQDIPEIRGNSERSTPKQKGVFAKMHTIFRLCCTSV